MASLWGKPQHLPQTSPAQTPLSYSSRIVLHKQPSGLGSHTKTLP